MTPEKTLAEMERELLDAKDAYVGLEKEASFARNKATDARNRLNDAQKQFDAGLVALRKSMPSGTGWNVSHGVRD